MLDTFRWSLQLYRVGWKISWWICMLRLVQRTLAPHWREVEINGIILFINLLWLRKSHHLFVELVVNSFKELELMEAFLGYHIVQLMYSLVPTIDSTLWFSLLEPVDLLLLVDVTSALADATDHLVEASPFQSMVEFLDFVQSFLPLLCFDQLTLKPLADEVDSVALSIFGSCIILEWNAHSGNLIVDRLPLRRVSV